MNDTRARGPLGEASVGAERKRTIAVTLFCFHGHVAATGTMDEDRLQMVSVRCRFVKVRKCWRQDRDGLLLPAETQTPVDTHKKRTALDSPLSPLRSGRQSRSRMEPAGVRNGGDDRV